MATRKLALVTSRDEADALELARHDYAHVLAEAIQALWPGTQITFGPATDDGFYYDVMAPASRDAVLDRRSAGDRGEDARDHPRRQAARPRGLEPRSDLIDSGRTDGETFKAEWAAELPEDEELTVYHSGEPGERRRVARHVPRAAPRPRPASSIPRPSS